MVENRKINPWTWQNHFGFSQASKLRATRGSCSAPDKRLCTPRVNQSKTGDMAAQIMQALDNLETVLQAADMTLANVVRLNLYVTDIDAALENFGPMEERLAAAGIQPAITLLGVSRLFIPSLLVEMEADAVA